MRKARARLSSSRRKLYHTYRNLGRWRPKAFARPAVFAAPPDDEAFARPARTPHSARFAAHFVRGIPTRSLWAPHQHDFDARAFTRALYAGGQNHAGPANVLSCASRLSGLCASLLPSARRGLGLRPSLRRRPLRKMVGDGWGQAPRNRCKSHVCASW